MKLLIDYMSRVKAIVTRKIVALPSKPREAHDKYFCQQRKKYHTQKCGKVRTTFRSQNRRNGAGKVCGEERGYLKFRFIFDPKASVRDPKASVHECCCDTGSFLFCFLFLLLFSSMVEQAILFSSYLSLHIILLFHWKQNTIESSSMKLFFSHICYKTAQITPTIRLKLEYGKMVK